MKMRRVMLTRGRYRAARAAKNHCHCHHHNHQCTNIPGWSSAPSSFQCSECDPGYNSWTSYTGLNISDDDTDNANDADDAGDKCLWLR